MFLVESVNYSESSKNDFRLLLSSTSCCLLNVSDFCFVSDCSVFLTQERRSRIPFCICQRFDARRAEPRF
jgi:hypothetical protein